MWSWTLLKVSELAFHLQAQSREQQQQHPTDCEAARSRAETVSAARRSLASATLVQKQQAHEAHGGHPPERCDRRQRGGPGAAVEGGEAGSHLCCEHCGAAGQHDTQPGDRAHPGMTVHRVVDLVNMGLLMAPHAALCRDDRPTVWACQSVAARRAVVVPAPVMGHMVFHILCYLPVMSSAIYCWCAPNRSRTSGCSFALQAMRPELPDSIVHFVGLPVRYGWRSCVIL